MCSYHWHYDYPKIARDSGFLLKQCKDGVLDWRLIGSTDIDRLIQEQNFDKIDNVVSHLSEAPISATLDTHILDSGIIKYFVLSQLSIQYLLFCKKFLDETVTTLRESLCESQMENLKLTKLSQESTNEILQLHKKVQNLESINEVVYPCALCTKNFVSNDMLNVHMKRKHARAGVEVEKDNDRNLINTIKLELEIKQLKERLNIAEKDIKHVSDEKDSLEKEKRSSGTQSEAATRNIGIQSNLIEEKEADDAENAALTELQEKIIQIEDWKKAESTSNQKSITEIQEQLQKIAVSLEEKTFKEIPVKEPSKVEDLQQILNSAVVNFKEQSTDQLNIVVQRIESSYEEKLKDLREEISKQNEVISKGLAESREHLAASRERLSSLNGPREQLDGLRKAQLDSFVVQQPQAASTERLASSSGSLKGSGDKAKTYLTDVIQKALSSEEEDSETCEEESYSEEEELEPEVKPSLNRQFPEETPKTIKKLKKEKVLPPPKPFKRRDALRMTDRRLKSVGIPPATKTISTAVKKDIAHDLQEHRGKLKKVYPNFYATRNKLKKFVDKFMRDEKKKKEIVDKIIEQPLPAARVPETSTKDEFKMRLEKILGSPIQKPAAFSTPNEETSPEPDKPVPLPRKRVMFDFASARGQSSDDQETTSNVSSLI